MAPNRLISAGLELVFRHIERSCFFRGKLSNTILLGYGSRRRFIPSLSDVIGRAA